ncbi:MAG TPA: sugar-binding protein [Armatimonadota bacterium]|jgi:hypothetical protein
MSYFRICCCSLLALLLAGVAGALTLAADTSRPEMSTFIPGEEIALKFTVTGLTAADAGLKLQLDIVDEFDKSIKQQELPVAADANGAWQGTVMAPNQRLGFYRVNAKLSNGVTLPKLRSRPAGYLTYCIVPDPAERQLYPANETFFGMQGGFCPTVNVLPYLGIRWGLGGYGWSTNEPNRPGEFTESRDKARAEGKSLPGPSDWSWCKVPTKGKETPWKVYRLPCLYGAANWAVIPESKGTACAVLTPEGEKAWRNYCLEIGKALKEDSPELSEHLVQITWEPVYPWGFKGTDEQLIKIYEVAYPALHEADPKIVVLGPTGAGIGKSDIEWNLRLIKAGLAKYIDGLAIHPYHAVPPEREGYILRVRSLKEGLLQATGRQIGIYGTEQGRATNEEKAQEIDQALGLTRENLILFGEGARLNFAFYIADYPGEPGYGFYYNLNPQATWGTNITGPKPAAPAYAAMTYLLEGHKSAGAIEWLGETAWGYAFERADDIVLAVWDFGDTPRQVSIPVGVKQVAVYDWMGNKQIVNAQDDSVKVTLTPAPTYIKGVSPQLWSAKAEKPLKLTQTRMTSFAGAQARITGSAAAVLGKDFKGSVILEADPASGINKMTMPVAMKAGEIVPVVFTVPIPAKAKLGTYAVKVNLVDASGSVAASGIMLTIAPPVAISSVYPVAITPGKTSVRVTLKDEQGQAAQGTVQLKIQGVPDSQQSAKYTMPAKGSQAITLSYDDLDISAARTYTALVTVTTAAGAKSEKAFPIDFLCAKQLTKAPVIDGELADWAGVPTVTLKGQEFCVRSKEYFNPSLSANVRYAWDAKALYLAVEVRDSVFVQDFTGFNTWKGDCLQVAFDLDPGQVEEKTGNVVADNAASKRRVCEIDLALTKNGPDVFRTGTFDVAKFPIAGIDKAQLPLAARRVGDMTIYEAAIPWSTLGLTKPPTTGTFLGTAITVNDMNDAKQLDPSALGLFGGISGKKDPDKFGILLLGGVE